MFEKVLGGAAAFLTRRLIGELRETNQVLKVLVDTLRHAYGMEPVYSPGAVVPVEPVENSAEGSDFVRAGDFLSALLIEELAREAFIPIDASTNLGQLAEDQGWVKDGKFLMVPRSSGLTVEQVNGELRPAATWPSASW
ncbi:MAG TPA: hypothetical protein VFO16_14050 [Pseudonocardiaceae bacterium]|nr:hypothetical protein [Pseudonocardiaceae bacterium]